MQSRFRENPVLVSAGTHVGGYKSDGRKWLRKAACACCGWYNYVIELGNCPVCKEPLHWIPLR